jgi:hypothetical protein
MTEVTLYYLSTRDEEDYAPLAHLGAATLLFWDDLPSVVRRAIRDMAVSSHIIGPPRTAELKQHVDGLIQRNRKNTVRVVKDRRASSGGRPT